MTSAPFTYLGFQPGLAHLPGFNLFNLTRPIGPYPEGSTVTENTLKGLGFSAGEIAGVIPKAA